MVALAAAYYHGLSIAPLPTKAATAALIATAGDAIAQLSDPRIATYQVARGQCFSLFAAGYSGAFQHVIFDWLDEHCRGSVLSSLLPLLTDNWRGAVERTLLNQLVIIPLLYLPLFLLVSGMARGHRLRVILGSARRLYLPILRRQWAFWLPVQLYFFGALEPRLTVPATLAAGFFWNMILSMTAYSVRAGRGAAGERPPDVPWRVRIAARVQR